MLKKYSVLSTKLDPIEDADSMKKIFEISNSIIYDLGGIAPDRTLLAVGEGKYAHSRFSVQWDIDSVDDKMLSCLENTSSVINSPWIIEGRKNMFGEKIKTQEYTSLKGMSRPKMRGYLIRPNVNYSSKSYNNELWVVAKYKSKKDARKGKFHDCDGYLVDLKDRHTSALKVAQWIASIGVMLSGNPDELKYEDIFSACFRELVKSNIDETHFKDIIGLDSEIKEFIYNTFSPHINPDICKKYGYSPRSQLLVGVPGVGKSLIARAAAYDIENVLYLPVDMSQILIDTFYEDINEVAEKTGKDIVVFCEDIDVVLSPNNASDLIISKLLNVIDGVAHNKNIVFCGSANNPQIIDPRFFRGSRIDVINYIPLPNKTEIRENMLSIFTKELSLADDVSVKKLAESTKNFSGALIAKLVDEAKISAIKRISGFDVDSLRKNSFQMSCAQICNDDFSNAMDKVKPVIEKLKLEAWDSGIKEWSKGYSPLDFYR